MVHFNEPNIHCEAVNGTESMWLEREEVERDRDIWAAALLPPGVGVSMWGGDFSPADPCIPNNT